MVDRQLVERILGTLNTFIGQLHAATWVGALLAQNAEDPDHQHAVKYGMQTNEAVIVLTIRKFQDIWRWHIEGTVRAGSPAHAAAEWILREAEARKLRETANQLVAHFGPHRGAWPLSEAEILALIQSNGWQTGQEMLLWGRKAMQRLILLRDAIRAADANSTARNSSGLTA